MGFVENQRCKRVTGCRVNGNAPPHAHAEGCSSGRTFPLSARRIFARHADCLTRRSQRTGAAASKRCDRVGGCAAGQKARSRGHRCGADRFCPQKNKVPPELAFTVTDLATHTPFFSPDFPPTFACLLRTHSRIAPPPASVVFYRKTMESRLLTHFRQIFKSCTGSGIN
ncbi:hypothetical protein Pan258_39790 [Symmachiella dynata]|nr:hypothetical protein Pan258_39790 [Symmachiella dynata]